MLLPANGLLLPIAGMLGVHTPARIFNEKAVSAEALKGASKRIVRGEGRA